MATLRVFTAVELPPPTRDAVARAARELLGGLRGVRPVPPANLHVTVSFLGDLEEERLPEVLDALRATVAPLPPALGRVAGLGAFPSEQRARVVWCGVTADDGALTRLFAACSAALLPLGFQPEERAFHPHVTIARVTDGRAARALAPRLAAARAAPPAFGPIAVDHLTVFESTLSGGAAPGTSPGDGRLHGERRRPVGRRAPRYDVLARLALTGGTGGGP